MSSQKRLDDDDSYTEGDYTGESGDESYQPLAEENNGTDEQSTHIPYNEALQILRNNVHIFGMNSQPQQINAQSPRIGPNNQQQQQQQSNSQPQQMDTTNQQQQQQRSIAQSEQIDSNNQQQQQQQSNAQPQQIDDQDTRIDWDQYMNEDTENPLDDETSIDRQLRLAREAEEAEDADQQRPIRLTAPRGEVRPPRPSRANDLVTQLRSKQLKLIDVQVSVEEMLLQNAKIANEEAKARLEIAKAQHECAKIDLDLKKLEQNSENN